MPKRMRKPVQLTFADRPRKDGKPRQKAGRKTGPRPAVRHRERAVHRAYHPLHITMRAMKGIPSFRTQVTYGAFEKAVRTTRREDFRIVEYSVQTNHLHLIVEANDKDALARGMKSFSVRANRLFNGATRRRRGRVWGDRYHRRDLTSPRQVRNALVYCLSNYKKHLGLSRGASRIDFASSARWFQGWTGIRAAEAKPRPHRRPTHLSPRHRLAPLRPHPPRRISPHPAVAPRLALRGRDCGWMLSSRACSASSARQAGRSRTRTGLEADDLTNGAPCPPPRRDHAGILSRYFLASAIGRAKYGREHVENWSSYIPGLKRTD